MNSWKIILAALVIFAAGVITGGVTVKLSGSGRGLHGGQETPAAKVIEPPGAPTPAVPPIMQRMEMLRRLETALNLSPAQREQIDAMVRDSQERVRKLWEPVRPKAQEEFRQLREKVKGVLDADQRAKFEEILRRRQARRGAETGTRPESAPESTR